ncbi:MAG: anaerobic ribonucleoside-triphosphate reductase activating protein, partial [Aquificaceae bacterium]
KKIGYLVKLDTNGHNPKAIEGLMGLLDYIAMDIKAPLHKYQEATRTWVDTKRIRESISLIMEGVKDYEFRTTVVKDLLSEEDIIQIGKLIKGAKRYYLQRFNPKKTLDPDYRNKKSYTDQKLQNLVVMLKEYVEECCVR